MTSKVSFTIRRPPSSSAPTSHPSPPPSRSSSRQTSFVPHQADSSDEEADENATELVTSFDHSGAQRLVEKPKQTGPLVIAPLANRDWKAVARARKQLRFIPDGAAAPTGKDGSQGGLGTRDTINSGPQATGLVRRETVVSVEANGRGVEGIDEEVVESSQNLVESEDDRARRALLASAGGNNEDTETTIDAIPLRSNESGYAPLDETDAYKQDVVSRPDTPTLADYERVPVSQFGAALLRGMGWKEGTAASRTRRGLVEPWLPATRPALLGIGAKERPVDEIPASKGGPANKRPDKRYMPLVKVERQGSDSLPPPSRSRSRSPSRSGRTSRVGSKSSSPYPIDKDKWSHHRSRDRNLDDNGHEKSGRDRDRDRRDRDRDADRAHDRRRELSDDRHSERRRERDRDDRRGRPSDYRRDERESFTRDRAARY